MAVEQGEPVEELLVLLSAYAREVEIAIRECRRVGDGESVAILIDEAQQIVHGVRRLAARAQVVD